MTAFLDSLSQMFAPMIAHPALLLVFLGLVTVAILAAWPTLAERAHLLRANAVGVLGKGLRRFRRTDTIAYLR